MDTPLVLDTLTPAYSNLLISLVPLWPSRHANRVLLFSNNWKLRLVLAGNEASYQVQD